MKTEQEGVTREARGQDIGTHCWRTFWELAPAQISPDCTINVWLFSHAFGGNLHCSSPWRPLPTDLQWPAHQRYWQQLNCPSRGLKKQSFGWDGKEDGKMNLIPVRQCLKTCQNSEFTFTACALGCPALWFKGWAKGSPGNTEHGRTRSSCLGKLSGESSVSMTLPLNKQPWMPSHNSSVTTEWNC